MRLDRLARGRRMNAAIGWTAAGTAVVSAVGSVLAGATLWGVFSLVVAAVAVGPALATREWTAMVPWPLPAVAAAAVLARVMGVFGELTAHLALAALALLFVVELEAFTAVDLSRRFSVFFGVLTAMAVQAVWIVAQFYSDRWLGSEFLSTQTELQRDIAAVTVVGAVLGVLCEWYLARTEPTGTDGESTNRGETQ